MGEPVYLQYPLVGGLDQKTSALYLDPQQNQADITNGVPSVHVGQVEKRLGMVADTTVSTAALLAGSGIMDPYLPAASVGKNLSGYGDVLFQPGFAWTLKSGNASYVGPMPTASVVRRPLPVQGSVVPIIADNVTTPMGAARAACWVQQAGANSWNVLGAFLDPATSGGLYNLPALNFITAQLQLVALLYINGTLCLFVRTVDGGGSNLLVYSLNPAAVNPAWAAQAGATLAVFNNVADCLDVVPFNGDPNHGYIVLYLAAGDSTTLHWRYFQAFASVATGTLASSATSPGNLPVYIQADYGSDVAFFHVEPLAANIYYDFYSGDGAFTALANGHVTLASLNAPNPPFALAPTLTGCCRMTTAYTADGVNVATQTYLTFTATDSTYVGNGGPILPVTMGVRVNRSTANAIAFVGAAQYPAGMMPIGRPMQPIDGLQVAASFCHAVQPCVYTTYLEFGNAELASSPRSQQQTLYLCDYRTGPGAGPATTAVMPLATAAPRQVDAYMDRWSNCFSTNPHVPPTASSDGKSCLVPTLTAATGPSGIAQDVGAHWLTVFACTAPTAPNAIQINQTAQFPGALPSRLFASGQLAAPSLLEHSFIHYPEQCFTAIGAAGALNSTYSYAVVYGRQDANGNIEYSAPDIITGTITPANQKVLIYFPALAWWANQTGNGQGYFVEIYRTVGNGSTFYSLTRLYPQSFGATATGFMWSYTDNTPDASLAGAAILYTTGGYLDNVNPPGGPTHIAHRSRYAVVDDTLRSVWFTQQETVGLVLGFNEALISPFIEGGDIVAMGSMDDKLVVFKAGSVWVQYGDGPASNGQGSDWTVPQLIPSDVGCVAASSVVLIPDGLMFMSSKGLCLLTRGLEIVFIGKAVQDVIAANPTCISSVVVPYANQARWCFQAAGGGQVVVVYDYVVKQWTKFTYPNLDAAIVQVLLVGGQFAVLTANGSRYIEAAASSVNPWLDGDLAAATHFVPTVIKTPPFRISGAQGYQRARRALVYGTQNDPCGVELQLLTDYQATVKQQATWKASQYDGAKPLEMHVGAPFMKSMAVQLIIQDVADASTVTGQGMSFAAIGLDMDKIGDRYRRLPQRNRA